MIIFYNKKTGQIIGTINGRVHPQSHLKMWMGDKEETERLIVNWKQVEDESKAISWQPDHKQADLFNKLDKREVSVYSYKVNLQTKLLVSK